MFNNNKGDKMTNVKLKIEKVKNNKGLEFNTIQISELSKVSPEMFEANEDICNGGYEENGERKSFADQCAQCNKGIKGNHTYYSIICVLSPEIMVQLNQDDIAKDSGGYMNSFQLGPECARRLKKALKEININWKDYLIEHKKERI